jgi:hypothetical protein
MRAREWNPSLNCVLSNTNVSPYSPPSSPFSRVWCLLHEGSVMGPSPWSHLHGASIKKPSPRNLHTRPSSWILCQGAFSAEPPCVPFFSVEPPSRRPLNGTSIKGPLHETLVRGPPRGAFIEGPSLTSLHWGVFFSWHYLGPLSQHIWITNTSRGGNKESEKGSKESTYNSKANAMSLKLIPHIKEEITVYSQRKINAATSRDYSSKA